MVHIPDGSGFHGGRPVPGELGEQGHQHARDDAVRQIFGTGGTCQIQYAVLKENDYKYPTTLEEYEAMIKSYLEAHPTTEDGLETIGITMSASDWHWMITLGNPAGFIADAQPDNGQWLIDENYNCTYKHASDDEKEYFKWPSRMYDEGILDPNFATQTDDDYIAKLASGRVVAITDDNWHYAQAHAALKAENKLDKTYCDLPVTMNADDKAPTLKDWGGGEPYLPLRPDREVHEHQAVPEAGQRGSRGAARADQGGEGQYPELVRHGDLPCGGARRR